jgi:Rrf2 family iron-sulfur cluster assembly transcriptional regulator
VAATDVSAALQIPPNYLAKILHVLAHAKVLSSSRGKHGGFGLAVPPQEISVLNVVSLFDRIDGEPTCLLGRAKCNEEEPCAAHKRWKSASEQIISFFRETTVSDLMSEAHNEPAILRQS